MYRAGEPAKFLAAPAPAPAPAPDIFFREAPAQRGQKNRLRLLTIG